MQQDIYFVIPTYRLRDVDETVEQYDQHFWRNGRAVKMIAFFEKAGHGLPQLRVANQRL